MFVFHNGSRRTLNAGTLLAACLAITLGIAWSGSAVGQSVTWSGAVSTDYNDGGNWIGGSVPTGSGQTAVIPASAPNYPTFNGGPDIRRLDVNYGGTFNMAGGSILLSQGPGNTRVSLGADAVSGTAVFNISGGSLQVDGQLITTDNRPTTAVVNYTQSGGTFFANVSGNSAGLDLSTQGNSFGVRTNWVMTGGTTKSAAAINFGRSNNPSAFFTGTISGGALIATRIAAPLGSDDLSDNYGTLRMQGGNLVLNGGQVIGSDISARSGWQGGSTNANALAPYLSTGTVGIQYQGGMVQVYTNLSGTVGGGFVYRVATSSDAGPTSIPVVTGTQVLNRGEKRLVIDVGAGVNAAWTSLPDTTAGTRVFMSRGVSPCRTDGVITDVASTSAFAVGDYTMDGVVDQGDYVYWTSQNGLTYCGIDPLSWSDVTNNDMPFWGADGNGDSKVDSADLAVWQAGQGNRRTDGIFQYAKNQTVDVPNLTTVSQSDAGFTVGSTVDNLNLTSFNAMNTKSFTKAGSGELVLTAANDLTYGATISNGKLRLSGSQAVVTSWSGTTTVETGATLQVDAGATIVAQRINLAGGNLTVAPGGQLSVTVTSPADGSTQTFGSGVVVSDTGSVTLSSSTPQTVNVQSLTVDTTTGGKVDIGRGTVNIASGTAVKIIADIVAGRNNGAWNGTSGITSSAAAAASSGDRAVGWIDNGSGSYTVAFGAAGDVNLNGVVDSDDVLQFLSANKYNTGSLATWAEGDYDYNGVVDADDVLAIVSANLYNAGPYNTAPTGLGGGVGVGVGQVNSVPEPATWAILAVGAACAAGRCLRRRSKLKA